MRKVTLHAGKFTQSSLEEISRREGLGIDALLRHALLYYLGDRDPRRVNWRYPAFLRDSGRNEGDVTVRLDEDSLRAAESEAEAQGVSVEHLLEHALLYFIAALETGRTSVSVAVHAARDNPPRP